LACCGLEGKTWQRANSRPLCGCLLCPHAYEFGSTTRKDEKYIFNLYFSFRHGWKSEDATSKYFQQDNTIWSYVAMVEFRDITRFCSCFVVSLLIFIKDKTFFGYLH
jgi:hypothetical protein